MSRRRMAPDAVHSKDADSSGKFVFSWRILRFLRIGTTDGAQLSPAALLLGRGQDGQHYPRQRTTEPYTTDHQRQISLFEQTYGLELFQRAGRQLELTETGRQALVYAEQMFQIGGELEAMLRAGPQEQILFRVGVADVVPKSIVYRLLAPTMELDEVLRINCREDKLERLLADLAIQRLDLVISDSPMPGNLDIKGYSQKLGECGLSFFATPALAQRLEGPFPACLQDAPLLVPGQETVVRSRLLRWLSEQQVQPRIVGEFDDSA